MANQSDDQKNNPENELEKSEDEIVLEESVEDKEIDLLDSEKNSKEKIKKLTEKLKNCEKEKSDYLTGWQRDKADFINLRKQDEKERDEFVKFALVQFFKEIINVIDSFDMAMADKKHWEKAPSEWRSGIENIHSQLLKTLEKNGLSRFSPLGIKFDPQEHEAVGVIHTEKKEEDHKILETVQFGYKIEGRIIRTAKVKVGEYKE